MIEIKDDNPMDDDLLGAKFGDSAKTRFPRTHFPNYQFIKVQLDCSRDCESYSIMQLF